MTDPKASQDALVAAAVRTAERTTGVIVPPYRWRVLGAEMRRYGGAAEVGEDAIVGMVASTPLVDLITIPESYLFRHEKQFRVLRLLTERLRDKGRACRVLCAGCANGEEVWSAAAVLASVPPPPGTQHSVVGWEISPARVERADQGRYGTWSRRNGLLDYEDYFSRQGEEVVASQELRNIVSFDRVNLVQDSFPPDLRPDVVLFRNVCIYWREETVSDVCRKLTAIAAPEAVFLVGPSDPIMMPSEWHQRMCGGTRSFWRVETPCPGECELAGQEPVMSGVLPRCRRYRKLDQKPRERRQAAILAALDTPPETASHTVSSPPANPLDERSPVVEELNEIDVLEEVAKLADSARYESALDLLEASEDRTTVDGKLWKGILLLSLDRNRKALEMFRQCVFLSPDRTECHHWLATGYDSLGHHERAEKCRRNARRLGES